MECNKEEAIRAKEIAQKKMENQDFAGARKIALKSQRLYPDLENINQLICVCDVHCSAENKKLGNERDWYDILKVEQSADEMMIKKQYRKLALLLHPDKNNFSGAEAAFMLIGEAQKVLLDKDKRFVYDARYRRFFQNVAQNPHPEGNKNAKNGKPSSGKKNMTKTGSSHVKKKPQQADPLDPSVTETFWTVCPFCLVRYRYRKTALDKNLKCHSCKKAFIAYDMCANSTPGRKVNQTETSAQGVFNRGMGSTTSKAGVHANSGQPPSGSNASPAAACAKTGVSNKGGSSGTSNGRFQGNPGEQKSGGDAFAKSGLSTQAGKSNKTNELNTGAKRRASSGGSNQTESKVIKKGKKQEAVEKAGGTVGDSENKKQTSDGKKGDTVPKKEKNQASAGKTGDTVTTKEKNQSSAGKAGDTKEKNQASSGKTGDSVTKKEKNQASAEKTGGTITKKEKNQASAGKTGDTVTRTDKQVSADKAGDRVANRAKKEVTDSPAKSGGRSQSRVCTGPEDKIAEKGGDASAGSRQSKRRACETEIGGGAETLNSLKRHKGNAEEGSTEFRQPPDENDISVKDKPSKNHCVKERDLHKSCKVDKSDPSLDATAKTQTQHVPDNDFNEFDLTQPQHVPDNDFSDFDLIRQESSFKTNQIWAVYDTIDTMPRFYAIIKRVFSHGSKLRITWLDPVPDENYARLDFPISCGKFVPGDSETTEEILTFSHPMCWEKGKGKDGSIIIYPKKGETWALFRDWHMDWMSDPNISSRKFEFEFVEILSDYDASEGIRVAVLEKLKGFSGLFCREGRDEEIHIPPSECLRFSHRVPSYIMTGEEGEGVPKGSYELDLASIPFEIGKKIPLPEEVNAEKVISHSSVPDSELQGGNPYAVVKEKELGIETDQLQSTSDDVDEHLPTEPCERPEPEFFNFDATRDLGRFQVDQVWALYNDTDGLPNCYGQIKRVCLDSPMKLKIAWLKAQSRSSDLILWRNKEIPICCGKFKITNRKLQGYCDSLPFSHELQVETIKMGVFEIFPKNGQIWALYKNWNVDMTPSDLENCDYDVVEVLEQSINGSPTQVLVLEKVSGYNSVFKVKMNESSLSSMEIPCNELLRFSHQIPAHVLTDEKEGSLRGFKELDTSALPPSFFLPNVSSCGLHQSQ